MVGSHKGPRRAHSGKGAGPTRTPTVGAAALVDGGGQGGCAKALPPSKASGYAPASPTVASVEARVFEGRWSATAFRPPPPLAPPLPGPKMVAAFSLRAPLQKQRPPSVGQLGGPTADDGKSNKKNEVHGGDAAVVSTSPRYSIIMIAA